MRNVDEFARELERAQKKPDPGYGGVVFPAAKVFSSILSEGELSAFKEAVARLLTADEKVRNWAARVCVGFIYFSTNITPPILVREFRIAGEPERAVVRSSSPGQDKLPNDRQYFVDALTRLAGGAGDVEDALRLHAGMRDITEPKVFLDAIEQILSSPDERVRRYGVDVCVEFVLQQVPPPLLAEPEGPTEFVVHSREPFRLNPNFKLRARKPVAIHLPRDILSPPGTPLSEIVVLSNPNATVGLLEAKPGEGVAAIIIELAPGEEIYLTRPSPVMVDDGTKNGVIVFDAQAG